MWGRKGWRKEREAGEKKRGTMTHDDAEKGERGRESSPIDNKSLREEQKYRRRQKAKTGRETKERGDGEDAFYLLPARRGWRAERS